MYGDVSNVIIVFLKMFNVSNTQLNCILSNKDSVEYHSTPCLSFQSKQRRVTFVCVFSSQVKLHLTGTKEGSLTRM